MANDAGVLLLLCCCSVPFVVGFITAWAIRVTIYRQGWSGLVPPKVRAAKERLFNWLLESREDQ